VLLAVLLGDHGVAHLVYKAFAAAQAGQYILFVPEPVGGAKKVEHESQGGPLPRLGGATHQQGEEVAVMEVRTHPKISRAT